MLLQSLENLGQKLANKIVVLVVLLLLLLVVALLLLVMLLLLLVPALVSVLVSVAPGLVGRPALEVDEDAALILLRAVVQAELAAHVLDLGLQLLDVAGGVVALAHNDVQVVLAPGPVLANALPEDALGLLDELAVEIDLVGLDSPRRIVLAEDELGGLEVVLVHLAVVGLALVGELLGFGAVAVVVGPFRL